MLRHFPIGKPQPKQAASPNVLAINELAQDADSPIALQSLNELHENIKKRVYRSLIPHSLLSLFDINPITWRGPDKSVCIDLKTSGGNVIIEAWSPFDDTDPIFNIELSDNTFNSIDLNWLAVNDPASERFPIDADDEGKSTHFGTVHRNIEAEVQAMQAGLAPAQIRRGLRGSKQVLYQLEGFLIGLGHRSFSLEALTYYSAWIFERNGFAYMKGHQLMKTINKEFQPDGVLYKGLDGSTPFRQREQWRTVRGRAWAIHDGILEIIDESWNDIHMTKQIGRFAGVNTFPDAAY